MLTGARETVAALVASTYHDDLETLGVMVNECSEDELKAVIAILLPMVTNYVCHIGQRFGKPPEDAIQAFCLFQMKQTVSTD